MSGQDCVSHARMLLTPCYPIGLSPLHELNRGKPVSSIVVNTPYYLSLTLCIISSNIYTGLAGFNCL